MPPTCPTTPNAISERSNVLKCDQTHQYHCMRDKEDEMIEKCLEISWIEKGDCAVYDNEAQKVDSWKCIGRQGICPRKVYLSNQVMSYSACVPSPKRTNSTKDGFDISETPSDGSRFDNNNSTSLPLILVALIALIAVISVIVVIVIYKRRTRSLRNRTSEAIKRQKKEKDLSDSEEEKQLTNWADVSDNLESKIEEIRYVSEPYYKTRTYEYLERQVEEFAVSIVIIGNPGSGKSVLAEMLHNNFCGKKVNGSLYNSRQFKRLEDVYSYPSLDGVKMIYIIDDCFEDWNQYPHLVTTALEKFNKVHEEIVKGKDNSVVITMSKLDFEKNLSAVHKARVYQCDKLEVIDLSSRKFQLDITDRTGILEYHRKKNRFKSQRMDDNHIRKVADPGIMKEILCYLSPETQLEFEHPLSCRLFYSHESFVEQKEDFFMETKRKIREYVKGLSTGSSEEKNQYCTLIYVALNGGQVQLTKQDLSFLEGIAKSVGISSHDLKFNYECCLISQGNDNTYEIVHEEITKLLFVSFGYAHTTFVIDRCAVVVLLKYVRTCDFQKKSDYYQNGYLLLTLNMYDYLAKRLQNGDEVNWKHTIFKDEVFQRRFRSVQKGIKKA